MYYCLTLPKAVGCAMIGFFLKPIRGQQKHVGWINFVWFPSAGLPAEGLVRVSPSSNTVIRPTLVVGWLRTPAK